MGYYCGSRRHDKPTHPHEKENSLKRIILSALVGIGLILSLSTANPAAAASAVTFTGTVNINCFGCGVSASTATLKVSGTINGTTYVNATANAFFTVNEHPTTCPVTGSAVGDVTIGANSVHFTWNRVGANAVIFTSGAINGGGGATFAVTSPVGSPCGGPVTATLAGSVAGT